MFEMEYKGFKASIMQAEKLTGDFVWHIDCDEIYRPEDIQKVFNYLDSNPSCYSMAFRLRSFYGGFDRYISGFEENFEVHRIQKIIPSIFFILFSRSSLFSWVPYLLIFFLI